MFPRENEIDSHRMVPKCVLLKADPKTDGILVRGRGAIFHFNLESGNPWVSFAALGVGSGDLEDTSPSRGIKGNELQLQLLNFKSGISKKFLL